jgi:hypothetical protein
MPIIQALECLKSWLGIIKAEVDDPKEDKERTNTRDTIDEVIKVNTVVKG